MNWLTYLLEANIYLGVFYLCYCLLLNRDTHYNFSRIYLLASCILAFILPFTQLSILKPAEPEPTFAPVVTMVAQPVQQFAQAQAPQTQHFFAFENIVLFIYAAGVAVALFIFAIRLYKLFRLSQAGNSERLGSYRIIYLEHDNSAFSFFNYLFLSKNISQSATILNHEMVHIRQRHSADIIFIELLKVLNWFNPFIYLTERSLKTIHEYIADEQTAAHEQDALTYSSFLLQNAYGLQGSSIAHSFFNYNLLKKRIIMLNQKRSGRLARLKYLAVVPLCGGMLCTSTLVFSKDYGLIDLSPKVAENAKPDLIKYFRIKDTEKDITAYSDNISITEDGVKKVYRVNTITKADITHILKTHKLKIEVIDVDSKTYLPIPRVEFADTKADTAFAARPPAVFGKDYTLQENGYLIDKTKPYITVTITDKKGNIQAYNSGTATVAERQMLASKYNFRFKTKELMAFIKATSKTDKAFSTNPKLPPPPPPVIIKEEFLRLSAYISQKVKYPAAALAKSIDAALSAKFTITTDGRISNIDITGTGDASFKTALKSGLQNFQYPIKEKPGTYVLGVTFSVLGKPKPALAASIKNSINYVGETGVVGFTAEQKKAMHAAQPKAIGSIPPPPPPPVERNNKSAGQYPPPPPPVQSIYSNLMKYMGKYVRYPSAARDKNINGDVLLRLRLDENHKITDVKVIKGIGYGCDEEAVRALKSYDGIINKPAGTYQLMTTFALVSEDELSKSYIPKAIDSKIVNQRNFIGQVLIAGSVKTPATKPTTNGRIDEKPAGISNKSRALISTAQTEKVPLMIVNGKKFIPPALKDGQVYQITTEDSLNYYPPNNAVALQKWGTDAQYGVNEFFGRFTYVVKDRELVR